MPIVIDDPETEEKLCSFAKDRGISLSDAVRVALNDCEETMADTWRKSLKVRAREKRNRLAEAVKADRATKQGKAA